MSAPEADQEEPRYQKMAQQVYLYQKMGCLDPKEARVWVGTVVVHTGCLYLEQEEVQKKVCAEQAERLYQRVRYLCPQEEVVQKEPAVA